MINNWKVPGGERKSSAARRKAPASIHTHVAYRPAPGKPLKRISVAAWNRWVAEVNSQLGVG